jgi:hypothetical protein
MRVLLPLLAVALSGCAASATPQKDAGQKDAGDAAKLAAELAGLTPQKPVSCLNDAGQASIKAYGPTILYKVGRGLIYRNDTTGGCENIARGDILVTKTVLGRPCRGDIAHTVDPTSRTMTGSCAFGAFTPYKKVR